jgi:rhodanese-related sulfurtransferase
MSAAPDDAQSREISPEEAQRALEDGSAVMVDVREPYEREAGHIPGSEHIAMDELQARASELPQDKTVIFQCRLGGRSAVAAEAFAGAGYDARTMTGGIVRWDEEGRPLNEGGTVADH